MKRYPTNGWFPASEFVRVCRAISQAATQDHSRWLGHLDCKYISVYVDMRTGDFILRNREGHIIEDDELYAIFPELKD